MSLRISITASEKKDGAFILTLNGSLDTDTYSDFEKEMATILAQIPKVVIVNMQGLNYISSMGLGVVIKARGLIKDNGGEIILTSLQPQIKKVFEIVKTMKDLNVFDTMEEADEYIDKIQKDFS